MATAIVRGDKTKFVTEFLTKNPKGNVRTINEAWTVEGMEGKVSKTVVDKTRARLGLTGNLGAKSKVAAKPKTAPKRTRKATTTPGKAGFTKEFLNDHPDATSGEVNEAWTKAGMQGRISHTTVSEVRKSLGLIVKPRTATQAKVTQAKTPTIKPRGSKAVTETKVATRKVAETSRQDSSRTTVLLAVESEIDRLIFTIMGLGDLPEIETALRDARRRVCKATPT
jgi:hypothetical protein